MAVLKTGLGERLVSTDVEAKAFDQLPVIDLQDLESEDFEKRKALAAEVSTRKSFHCSTIRPN